MFPYESCHSAIAVPDFYMIFCNVVVFLEGIKSPVQVKTNAVKISTADDNEIH